MTYNNNNVYVREDAINARLNRIEAIIERNISTTKDVRLELKTEITGLSNEVAALGTQVSGLRAEIAVQNVKIDSLTRWNSWLLWVFVVVFLMPYSFKRYRDSLNSIDSPSKPKNSD